jgi:hypothetical protein
MASRLGSGYYVSLVKETEYGTAITNLSTATHMFDVTCEIKNEPIITDTGVKTGTVQPYNTEKIITGTGGTVTISGNVCTEYAVLLQAYFHEDATVPAPSVYNMQEASTAPFSYTIYQLFEADTTPSGTAYNIAAGCVLTEFSITGESNGILQFTSTWRAKLVDRAITTALTNGVAGWGAGTPFLFGSVTGTLFNAKTTFNSFAINLSKVLADDRISYQNSMARTAEYLTQYTGTLDVETIYDDAADHTFDGNIGSQTAVDSTIAFVNGAVSWTWAFSTRIASFTQADPDKSLFVAQYSLELARDAAAEAVTVTVA